jgi:hypothetical protein
LKALQEGQLEIIPDFASFMTFVCANCARSRRQGSSRELGLISLFQAETPNNNPIKSKE